MSGEDHLIEHTSKTVSTRSIKIDDESKKSETRERNWQSVTEMAMENEFGKRGSEERMEEKI